MPDESPFAQIYSGIVPDAIYPYDVQGEAQKKISPFKQILDTGQAPKISSGEEAPDAAEEKFEPDTTYPTKPKEQETKPKEEKPFYQGAVDFGNALKKEAYSLPYVGEPIREVGQAINNANRMKHEFFGGENQEAQPLHTTGAAGLSAAAGATGAVEAPVALATNALSNLLIPQEARTKRVFPQQPAATPEAQAQKVLQQGQTHEPQRYTYNYGVQGKPLSRRLSDLSAKTFPNQPGARATGELAGGLAPIVPGVNAGEGAIIANLMKNPEAAKAIQTLAEMNPAVKSFLHGALEGGAYGAVYGAGGRAMEGQEAKVTPEDVTRGAVFGGLIRPAAEAVGAAKQATEKPAATPEQQAAQPLEEAAQQQTEPVVQKRVVGQVIKPKQPTFANAQEALDAFYGSNTTKAQAAAQWMKDNLGARDVEETGRPEAPQKLQAEQAQEAPEEKPPESNPALEAMYQKIGKQPVEDVPAEETEAADNRYVKQQRVPIEQVDEGGRKTKEDKGKSFDTTNTEPREAYVTIDGVRRKHWVTPLEFDENGNVSSVRAHAITEGRSSAEKQLIRERAEGERSLAARLAAQEALKGEPQHAQERGEALSAEGKTPEMQAKAISLIKKRQSDLLKAQDLIENNDLAGLEKLQKGQKKLTDIKGDEGTKLYSDPLMIGPMIHLAKATGKALPEVAKLFSDELPTAMTKLVKMQDTLDRIEEGANQAGHDIHNKLWHNLAGEAYDTHGLKLEGEFGQEARDAIRRYKPKEIMDPEIFPHWTKDQREQVAIKRAYREDTKKQIKDLLKANEGNLSPDYERALKEYSSEQYGHYGKNDIFGRVLDDVTGNLFNSFFRYNPGFHALIAAHPLQMGTAVAGVKNIADAYRLLATNPEVRQYLGGHRGVTEDIRTTAGTERFQRQNESSEVVGRVNKPIAPSMQKDLPTGRVNNEVIMLASILKKANEMYKGKGEEAFNKLIKGQLPKEEALELLVGGMQGLRDATGAGTFGLNRTMLQDAPVVKYFAQLSGYKHIVARFQSKQAQKLISGTPGEKMKALGALTTLTGATLLLGGHAVINKELEEPLAATIGPQRLYALEKALDYANLPSKVGVNLVNHMQYSLLNYGENAAFTNVAQTARDLYKLTQEDSDKTPAEKWTDFLGHALMMTKLSAPLGIGLSTEMKAKQGMYDLARKNKTLRVYSKDWMSPSIYAQGKGDMDFNLGDFLYTMFAPGEESRRANFGQKVKFEHYFKKYAPDEAIPYKQMDKDYPSKGIEWQ